MTGDSLVIHWLGFCAFIAEDGVQSLVRELRFHKSFGLDNNDLHCNFLILSVFYSISAAAAKSLQSCPTLCNPIDGGPPGSPVPGILQARTLEWVAISFSNS